MEFIWQSLPERMTSPLCMVSGVASIKSDSLIHNRIRNRCQVRAVYGHVHCVANVHWVPGTLGNRHVQSNCLVIAELGPIGCQAWQVPTRSDFLEWAGIH